MNATTQQIPEVMERDAAGVVAVVYGEIKEFSGVGIPALVYRHLATEPDALDYVWSAVRPLFVDGSIQETAASLVADMALPGRVNLPPYALEICGVQGKDRLDIENVVETYNRLNAINVLVVSIALQIIDLDAERGGSQPTGATRPPPLPLQPLPPVLALKEMSPPVQALIRHLSKYVPGSDSGQVIPTLYRHLAHWPGFLAISGVQILQLLETGAIPGCADALRRKVDTQADALIKKVRSPAITAGQATFIRDALEPFRTMIPQLLVIGRILSTALEAQA
jgi:hypothetical protein